MFYVNFVSALHTRTSEELNDELFRAVHEDNTFSLFNTVGDEGLLEFLFRARRILILEMSLFCPRYACTLTYSRIAQGNIQYSRTSFQLVLILAAIAMLRLQTNKQAWRDSLGSF